MDERERRKIAIDKDDVLIDFNSQLCNFHNERYGTRFSLDDVFDFDLHLVWGCNPEEVFGRLMDFYQSSHFELILPINGALEAVSELKRKYELFIVTARPPEIIEATHRSVERFFPNTFSGVHFAHSSGDTMRSKAEVCADLGIEVLIDDSIKNIRGCRDVGMETYLFRRPWNIQFSDEELRAEKITPVRSWQEILGYLE